MNEEDPTVTPLGCAVAFCIGLLLTCAFVLFVSWWNTLPGAPGASSESARIVGPGDNLGKNESELEGKFGPSQWWSSPFGQDYPGAYMRRYVLGAGSVSWWVEATFLPAYNACEIITYQKWSGRYSDSNALNEEEIRAALRANSGNHNWTADGPRRWVREDGATARIEGGAIQITSARALNDLERRKREDAQKIRAQTSRF